MIELFTDISPEVKDRICFLVDRALEGKNNLKETVLKLEEYRKLFQKEDEKDFFDFYIRLKLQLSENELGKVLNKDEDNSY